MPGNRDFLLERFLHASGMAGIGDPTVLVFGGARWLLSHGDALCLDDVPYQQFRRVVRDPAWQRDVLARSLADRRALARHIREQERALQAMIRGTMPTSDPEAAGNGCRRHAPSR